MSRAQTIKERVAAAKQTAQQFSLSAKEIVPRDVDIPIPASFEEAIDGIDNWKALQKGFLVAVQAGATFMTACSIVGVSRTTYHNWRKEDKFEAALRLAVEDRNEILIEEARRRAVDGVVRQRKMVVNGELYEWEEIEYSDKLLQVLLTTEVASTHPEFKPSRKVEVEGKVDHFMSLAEKAQGSQAEYDKLLESGAEDVVDGSCTPVAEVPAGPSEPPSVEVS